MKQIVKTTIIFFVLIYSCKTNQRYSDNKCYKNESVKVALSVKQTDSLQTYLTAYFNPPCKIEQFCFFDRGTVKYKDRIVGMFEVNMPINHLPSLFILKHIDDSIDIISGVDIHLYDKQINHFLIKHKSYFSPNAQRGIIKTLNKYSIANGKW
jgi:hypothetical protein